LIVRRVKDKNVAPDQGELFTAWRVSSEQLSYQSNPHNELSRPIALFEETQSDKPRKVIVDGWDQELLGCSVQPAHQLIQD
jgi:hypothetical protein